MENELDEEKRLEEQRTEEASEEPWAVFPPMIIEHWLYVKARCPINNAVDTYSTTIRTRRIVKVEEILAAAKAYEDTKIFQEDLTRDLATKLCVDVETVGYHSGVRTTVRAGNGVR